MKRNWEAVGPFLASFALNKQTFRKWEKTPYFRSPHTSLDGNAYSGLIRSFSMKIQEKYHFQVWPKEKNKKKFSPNAEDREKLPKNSWKNDE